MVPHLAERDAHAYLERLELAVEEPSVEALNRLHAAHVERVPYETTWIHMGEQWGVDRNESVKRIVDQRRGGYCFHLNGALSLLLDWLGYDVTLHVGGVHGPDGPSAAAMENHLVLVVTGVSCRENPGGAWHVDAGLGDALHEPLPMIAGRHTQGPFTFDVSHGDGAIVDWQFGHHHLGSFDGMGFRSEPTAIETFASRNRFLSTSPDSSFAQTVTAQRRDATGVDVLRGKVLRRVEATIVSETVVDTRGEWFATLVEVFGLDLSAVPESSRDTLWRSVERSHKDWMSRSD